MKKYYKNRHNKIYNKVNENIEERIRRDPSYAQFYHSSRKNGLDAKNAAKRIKNAIDNVDPIWNSIVGEDENNNYVDIVRYVDE